LVQNVRVCACIGGAWGVAPAPPLSRSYASTIDKTCQAIHVFTRLKDALPLANKQ